MRMDSEMSQQLCRWRLLVVIGVEILWRKKEDGSVRMDALLVSGVCLCYNFGILFQKQPV